MEEQELLNRAIMMKEQSEEVEKQLNFIVQQVNELDEFGKTLDEFEDNNEKEILASLGKGVFAKADRKEEKLFVEVGANVLVRKTPKEAKKIIYEQIKKFTEARVYLTAQLEAYKQEFTKMLNEVEKLKKKKL